MDFDTIGRNELIGRLQLGCECPAHFIPHCSKSSSNITWLFCLWLSPRQHIRHFIDNYQIYIQISNKGESVKLCEKPFGISLILFSSISFQSRYLLSFKVVTHQEVMRLSSGKRWSQSPGNQPWSGTGENACLSLRNCLSLYFQRLKPGD